jgi:hypothetical protein
MALLDRFRTHPPHKHPDPAVRLAYVEELSIDDREQLAAIARDDDDARIRRAAVAKLMDPPALATLAREDRDEGVRIQALEMLRDIALEAFEGLGEREALAAVEVLADAKTLALVAKTASREAVARAALGSLEDVRTLGSIARHAAVETVRRAALDRIQDHQEILAVAMNSDFKDTAQSALDRISDRGELEQVATRAKNKSAAKRARAVAREMDERAAAEAAAAGPPPPDPAELARLEEARVARERALEAGRASVEAERARVEAEHARLDAERARVEVDAARQREERKAAERAKLEVERQRVDAEIQKEAERRRARLAELADEADAAAGDADLTAARRRLTVARREWEDLIAGVAVAPGLAERLAAAETKLAAREADAHEAAARARRDALARLQQLAVRAEALLVRPDLSLKRAERAVHDVRAALADVPPLPSRRDYDDITRRLKAAQSSLIPKVQEMREAEGWKQFANLGVQEHLCAKMEGLRALEDPEEIARQIRDLQQQWRQAADVPRAQGEALWRRFKAAHDEVWARCEAHFAAQAQERAANLARKIALCERAEALAGSTSWIQTADEIKKLQAEWKTIGRVTRGQEKAIWERFRGACDRFFTRRHEDLAQRKVMWAANFAKKEALCVKAEALAQSTDWEATAAEIRRLQAEWKTIGPVKKTRSEAIWQRFRGACDQFFLRYAQRHDIAKAERVAAREAICAELESLAPSPGSPAPSPESPAPSPESAAPSPEAAASSPDSLATSPDFPATSPQPPATSVAPPADLAARVRALRTRWHQEIAARGVDRERAVALDARFQAAFTRVIARWPSVFGGSDLDPDSNRKRMEALVKRMEDLAASLTPGGIGGQGSDAVLSPTTRLAAMLKEALAANTIGGKVDEDSRWRAAQEDVRQAQASWARIGPVAEDARRALADRFARACRAITERNARATEAGKAGGAGRAGR